MAQKKLPATVLALGAVSFFTDISSDMIASLMPAFLVSMSAGAIWLGILDGAGDTTASLMKIFSGVWADKVSQKKPLVVLGYGLSSLCKSLLFLAGAPWQVLLFRLGDRLGKGVRTSPRDALLANSVPSDERGRAFGFHRAADHAGSVVGSLLAILLLWLGYKLTGVFAFAVIPSIFAMIALVVFVPNAEVDAKKSTPEDSNAPLSTSFRRFLVVAVLFALANSPDALLLLKAQSLGVPLTWLPLLWAVFHLIKSVVSTPLGALSDRWSRRKVLLFGFVLYALSYVLFAYAETLVFFCVVLAMYGCYYGMTEGVMSALVADVSTPETRGRAFGYYHGAVGVAALPSGLLAGYLWDAYSPATALLTGAFFAGVAAIVFAMDPSLRVVAKPT
jgi:MFS family permease